MAVALRQDRRNAVSELKRRLIFDAARAVFESDGLEGASLRAIAAKAGYTPAALYFHFDSKEALYAEVLRESIAALGEFILASVARARNAKSRLRAAASGFFAFYAANPRDLDLGFYLFRGGMKPAGLGGARDRELNAALESALSPIATAARELGASTKDANLLMVDVFAHASGLLLLLHTGRIRMFSASAQARMDVYVEQCIERLTGN